MQEEAPVTRVPAVVPGLAVMEGGTGADLVVFVHGALDRGRSFRRVLELLAGECRTLAYDRRGYGDSQLSGAAPVGVPGHVADLVALLDGRRAVVVGHSFGGVTAMGAALRAPHLVRGLVLYETSVAWAPGWDDSVMHRVLGSDDPVGASLALMLGERYAAMPAAERERWREQAETFLAEERSIRRGSPPYDVSGIACPVLFGRSGEQVMSPIVEFLQQQVAGIEVTTVPASGHHGHRTDPEAFADLVRRGLRAALP